METTQMSVNKMWSMHAMDIVQQQNEMKYCFFMATTWMNLENILSKKKKKKKPITKNHILYHAIYMKYPE